MIDALGELLNVAAPPATIAEVETLARAEFGIDARATPLGGERDRNFHLQDRDGGAFVLKVIHPAEPADVSDLQSRLLLHLAVHRMEMSVPRLLRPRDGSALEVLWRVEGQPLRRVRCLTYLAGCPLHRTTSNATQRRHLGASLAQLDRALADFAHPADGHDLIWDLKSAGRVRPLLADLPDPHIRALAEGALDRFATDVVPALSRLRRQVIHNDFNPHNVLVDEAAHDRIAGIIDFGDAVRAPLVQDIAVAAAYQLGAGGHPLQGPADLAAGYHAVSALGADEIEVLPDLIATRLALTIAISSWHAARHSDNAAYLLRNQAAAWSGLQRLHDLPRGDAIPWLRRQIGAA